MIIKGWKRNIAAILAIVTAVVLMVTASLAGVIEAGSIVWAESNENDRIVLASNGSSGAEEIRSEKDHIVLASDESSDSEEISGEKHYIVFASDRHGNTEAIRDAMSGMPVSNDESVEYVSIIGDLVGEGVGRPRPTQDTAETGAESSGTTGAESSGTTDTGSSGAGAENSVTTGATSGENTASASGSTPSAENGNDTAAATGEDTESGSESGSPSGTGSGDNAPTAGSSKAPEFNTSQIYDEIMDVGFTKVKSAEDISILWADHDAGAVDDAGIVFADGGSGSGLMKTGLNQDGSPAYYIYGIAFYDMTKEENAEKAAEDFKDWVDTIMDNTVPLIVVCHVPLHYARGDNKGAAAWNEALNYAATGLETTSLGKTVTRDVVFLHGHNHTVETSSREPGYSGEFYVPCGAAMEIGPEENDFSRIYYTYTTAGYLNSNKSATLITVGGDSVTIEKHQNGAVTDGLYDTASRKSGDFATKMLTGGVQLIQGVPAYQHISEAGLMGDGGTHTYTGEPITPEITITAGGTELVEGKDFAVRYKDNVDAGTATAIVTGLASGTSPYSGSKPIQFTIDRAGNPLKIKARKLTIKAGALKKKKKTVKAVRVLRFVSKGEGKLSYKKIKGSSKITINKSSGKVTVKKGLGKGRYKVKVKVTAKGNSNYERGAVTAIFTVKVS